MPSDRNVRRGGFYGNRLRTRKTFRPRGRSSRVRNLYRRFTKVNMVSPGCSTSTDKATSPELARAAAPKTHGPRLIPRQEAQGRARRRSWFKMLRPKSIWISKIIHISIVSPEWRWLTRSPREQVYDAGPFVPGSNNVFGKIGLISRITIISIISAECLGTTKARAT